MTFLRDPARPGRGGPYWAATNIGAPVAPFRRVGTERRRAGERRKGKSSLVRKAISDATITESDVPVALEHIFARERKGFEKSIWRLTPTQVAVLKGLATADAAKIYSSQFLESVRIASTGAVKKAVKRLEADELVYEWQRSWRFVDPFFREWIRRKI